MVPSKKTKKNGLNGLQLLCPRRTVSTVSNRYDIDHSTKLDNDVCSCPQTASVCVSGQMHVAEGENVFEKRVAAPSDVNACGRSEVTQQDSKYHIKSWLRAKCLVSTHGALYIGLGQADQVGWLKS